MVKWDNEYEIPSLISIISYAVNFYLFSQELEI